MPELLSGTILYGAGRKGLINFLGVESREYSEYRGAWGCFTAGLPIFLPGCKN